MELEIELENKHINRFKQEFNRACLQIGIPALSEDTCAKILAVVYLHDNEQFAYSGTFAADMEYIQNRYHIHGAGTPEVEFVDKVVRYIHELEEYARTHVEESTQNGLFPAKPQWAIEMFRNMYGIRI